MSGGEIQQAGFVAVMDEGTMCGVLSRVRWMWNIGEWSVVAH
jgi:hypothetical protein